MSANKFSHHFISHEHEGEEGYHHAHILSFVGLFTYLQIFIFVTGCFYFLKTSGPSILGVASFSADQIIALTNAKRAENGVGAVSFNGNLAQAAAAKAVNMFSEDYWAHNSPSGKTPWTFISAAGYRYVYAGENLARDFGDPDSVMSAWMNSPSHRANLLDGNFKEIGVAVESGVLGGHEGVLVVQMFGSAISQIPSSQTVAQASPKPEPKPAASASPAPVLAQAKPSPSPTPAASEAQTSINRGSTPKGVEPLSVEDVPTNILATRQFSIAKLVSLGFVSLIFALFAFEVAYTSRKAHLTLRSGVIAHLGLLAFVLFSVWYAVQGAIV